MTIRKISGRTISAVVSATTTQASIFKAATVTPNRIAAAQNLSQILINKVANRTRLAIDHLLYDPEGQGRRDLYMHVDLLDRLGLRIGKSLYGDLFSLSDSISFLRGKGRVINDLLGTSDSQKFLIRAKRTFAEAQIFADRPALYLSRGAIKDTQSLADARVTFVISKSFADTTRALDLTNVGDNLNYSLFVTRADSQVVLESIRPASNYVRGVRDGFTDTQSFTDNKSLLAGLTKRDTQSLADAFSYIIAYLLRQSPADTQTIVDVRAFAITILKTDAFAQLERIYNRVGKALADGQDTTDALSKLLAKLFADTTSQTDSRYFNVIKSIADTASANERKYFTLQKLLADTPAPADAIKFSTLKALTESIAETDNLVKSVALSKTENTTAAERKYLSFSKQTPDSVAQSDRIIPQVGKLPVDLISMADQRLIFNVIKLFRDSTVPLDLIGVADGLIYNTLLNKADSITQLDNLTTITDYHIGASSLRDRFVDAPVMLDNQTGFSPLLKFDIAKSAKASTGYTVPLLRTNYVLYSEQFENPYWKSTGAFVSSNLVTPPSQVVAPKILAKYTASQLQEFYYNQPGDPYGRSWYQIVPLKSATNAYAVSNADLLIADTTSNHYIESAIIPQLQTTSIGFGYSVFVQAAGITQVRLSVVQGTGSTILGDFDLSLNKVINSSLTTDLSIQAVGGGWFLCRIAGRMINTANARVRIVLLSGGTNAFTGDNISGVYVWGAQLEAGADILQENAALMYVPTAGYLGIEYGYNQTAADTDRVFVGTLNRQYHTVRQSNDPYENFSYNLSMLAYQGVVNTFSGTTVSARDYDRTFVGSQFTGVGRQTGDTQENVRFLIGVSAKQGADSTLSGITTTASGPDTFAVGQQWGGIRYSGDTLENVSFLLGKTATVGTDPFYPLDNSPYSPYPAKFFGLAAKLGGPVSGNTIVTGNLLTQSESFLGWSISLITSALETGTTPIAKSYNLGQVNRITETATTGQHLIYWPFVAGASNNTSVSVAISCWVRYDGVGAQRDFVITSFGEGYVAFSTTNGSVISNTSGYPAGSINYGNGWYRCWAVIRKTNIDGTIYFGFWNTGGGNNSYTGTNGSLLIFGAQAELRGNLGNYVATANPLVLNTTRDRNSLDLVLMGTEQSGIRRAGDVLEPFSLAVSKTANLDSGTYGNHLVIAGSGLDQRSTIPENIKFTIGKTAYLDDGTAGRDGFVMQDVSANSPYPAKQLNLLARTPVTYTTSGYLDIGNFSSALTTYTIQANQPDRVYIFDGGLNAIFIATKYVYDSVLLGSGLDQRSTPTERISFLINKTANLDSGTFANHIVVAGSGEDRRSADAESIKFNITQLKRDTTPALDISTYSPYPAKFLNFIAKSGINRTFSGNSVSAAGSYEPVFVGQQYAGTYRYGDPFEKAQILFSKPFNYDSILSGSGLDYRGATNEFITFNIRPNKYETQPVVDNSLYSPYPAKQFNQLAKSGVNRTFSSIGISAAGSYEPVFVGQQYTGARRYGDPLEPIALLISKYFYDATAALDLTNIADGLNYNTIMQKFENIVIGTGETSGYRYSGGTLENISYTLAKAFRDSVVSIDEILEAILIVSRLFQEVLITSDFTRVSRIFQINAEYNNTHASLSLDYYTAITWGYGGFVAVAAPAGYRGTYTIPVSEDGRSWRYIRAPFTANWCDVIAAGGLYVATAYATSQAIVANVSGIINWNNLSSWTTTTLPFSADGWRLITNGSTIVALPQYTSLTTSIVVSSTDGINWTSSNVGVANNYSTGAYLNGNWILIAPNTSIAITSTDLVNWSTTSLPVTAFWTNAQSNGLNVVVVAAGTSSTISTADLSSWTQASLPYPDNWTGLSYGDGIFMASAEQASSVCYTIDGTSWRTYNYTSGNGVDYNFIQGASGLDLAWGADRWIGISGPTSRFGSNTKLKTAWANQVFENYYNQPLNVFNRAWYQIAPYYTAWAAESFARSAILIPNAANPLTDWVSVGDVSGTRLQANESALERTFFTTVKNLLTDNTPIADVKTFNIAQNKYDSITVPDTSAYSPFVPKQVSLDAKQGLGTLTQSGPLGSQIIVGPQDRDRLFVGSFFPGSIRLTGDKGENFRFTLFKQANLDSGTYDGHYVFAGSGVDQREGTTELTTFNITNLKRDTTPALDTSPYSPYPAKVLNFIAKSGVSRTFSGNSVSLASNFDPAFIGQQYTGTYRYGDPFEKAQILFSKPFNYDSVITGSGLDQRSTTTENVRFTITKAAYLDDGTAGRHVVFAGSGVDQREGTTELITFNISLDAKAGATTTISALQNSGTPYVINNIVVVTARDRDRILLGDDFQSIFVVTRSFLESLTIGSGIDQRQSIPERISFSITKLLTDTTPALDLIGVFDGLTYNSILNRYETLVMSDSSTYSPYPARFVSLTAKSGVNRTFSSIGVSAAGIADPVFIGQQYTGAYRYGDPFEKAQILFSKPFNYDIVTAGNIEGIFSTYVPKLITKLANLDSDTYGRHFVFAGSGVDQREGTTELTTFNITLDAKAGLTTTIAGLLNGGVPTAASTSVVVTSRDRDRLISFDDNQQVFTAFKYVGAPGPYSWTGSYELAIAGSGLNQRQSAIENVRFTITKLAKTDDLTSDTTHYVAMGSGIDQRETSSELITFNITQLKRETQPMLDTSTYSPYPARFFSQLMKSGLTTTVSGITNTAASTDRLFVGQQYGGVRLAGDGLERILFQFNKTASSDTVTAGSGLDQRSTIPENVRFIINKLAHTDSGSYSSDTTVMLDLAADNSSPYVPKLFTLDAKAGATTTISALLGGGSTNIQGTSVVVTARDRDRIIMGDDFANFFAVLKSINDLVIAGSGLDQRSTQTENVRFTITKLLTDSTLALDLTNVFDGITYNSILNRFETQPVSDVTGSYSPYVPKTITLDARAGLTTTVSGITNTARNFDRLFVGTQIAGTPRLSGDGLERFSYTVGKTASSDTVIAGSGLDQRSTIPENIKYTLTKLAKTDDVSSLVTHLVVPLDAGVNSPYVPKLIGLTAKQGSGNTIITGNLLDASETFTGWNLSLITLSGPIVSNTPPIASSLLGAGTISTITETATNGQHLIYKAAPAGIQNNIGVSLTISCWVRYNGIAPQRDFVITSFGEGFVAFSTTNGSVISNSNNYAAGSINYGNGWFRCWTTMRKTNATGDVYFGLWNTGGGNNSYTGTTGSLQIFGAQAELSPVLGNYVATSLNNPVYNVVNNSNSSDIVLIGSAQTGLRRAGDVLEPFNLLVNKQIYDTSTLIDATTFGDNLTYADTKLLQDLLLITDNNNNNSPYPAKNISLKAKTGTGTDYGTDGIVIGNSSSSVRFGGDAQENISFITQINPGVFNQTGGFKDTTDINNIITNGGLVRATSYVDLDYIASDYVGQSSVITY